MSFHISGHRESGLEVVCFFVSLLPDHVYPSGVFFIQYREPSKACPRIWQFSISINFPTVIDVFLQHYIQVCVRSSGDVNVFQWNGTWFFSRHVQFDSRFNVMTVSVVPWNGPEIVSCFTIIQRWVLKRCWGEDPSDSPRICPCSSPRSGLSRIKVDVLRTSSPPNNLTVPSAIGKIICSTVCGRGVNTSFSLGLQAWIPDASIFSNSSMSLQPNMSPFQVPSAYNTQPKNKPGKTFLPNWCSRDRSLARNRVIFDHCTKRNGPLNGSPLQGIRPPFFIQTLIATIQQKFPSLISPRIRQISWSMDIPIIIDAAFLHNIKVRMCSSGDVNVFQWNREWFFSRASKVWLWVQRDGGIWSFLTWTKNH